MAGAATESAAPAEGAAVGIARLRKRMQMFPNPTVLQNPLSSPNPFPFCLRGLRMLEA